MVDEIEFVNDWSELEAAVAVFSRRDLLERDYCECDGDCWGGHEYVSMEVEDAVEVIKTYVPRLLTQYVKLLELSYVLTDLAEKQNAHRTPEGLYLP